MTRARAGESSFQGFDLAFESTHFEDTDYAYAEPLQVHAGEGFRFECDYFNTETHELAFGNTVNDEMCILFITFWSAEGGGEIPSQGCFMQTIGDDGVARP